MLNTFSPELKWLIMKFETQEMNGLSGTLGLNTLQRNTSLYLHGRREGEKLSMSNVQ